MMYICITILAYFFKWHPKWQVLWGKEKHLSEILYEKLKNKISLKQINGQINSSSF